MASVSVPGRHGWDHQYHYIGVSARMYYARGSADDEVTALSDSKLVRFDEGNRGDRHW